MVRSKKWSSLRAWGMNIARRPGMARARVAVARKLAVILHRMWADATERFGKGDARIVPWGTMGEAISLRVPNLPAQARQGRETD
ncbi:transposase IS116/IS110/IS902 family protein [Mesorhizobium loti]|nr:transposase IS116/IS110/IS902 family protein [Mesorhizobium loti]